MTVDYVVAARRHIRDAHLLQDKGRPANAGQLFGFCVECGLKSLLVRGGAQVDAQGSLTGQFRTHMPKLGTLISTLTTLPDGRHASVLLSHLPSLTSMTTWTTDHRYWKESAIPIAGSLAQWELTALEIDDLLDKAAGGGVL